MSERSVDKRAAAERIVRELRERGYVAYFAGGCVRDMLIGVEPKDYDVATDATPEEIKGVFRNTKLVGEAFGVVLVRLMRCEVEVATFRSDGGYSDGRRPDEVKFTDAEHDAQRRDFTMNGLFYSPAPEDEVIDYVGGRADIERKIIRAIGEARQRFAEDYLRMLRAVRFAARLGWAMDDATSEAIRGNAKKLERISRERIGMEVMMMMGNGTGGGNANGRDNERGGNAEGAVRSKGRAGAAEWLMGLGLDGVVLNEPHQERQVKVLARLSDDADAVTALAAWAIDRHLEQAEVRTAADKGAGGEPRRFEDSPAGLADAGEAKVEGVGMTEQAVGAGGEPRRFEDSPAGLADAGVGARLARMKVVQIARRWRGALVLSNEQVGGLLDRLMGLGELAKWEQLSVAQRKRLLAKGEWGAIVHLAAAMGEFDMARIEEDAERLRNDEVGVKPTALVTGDDLVEAGMKPGPDFKRILDQVYDAQLEGRVKSKEQAMAMAMAMTAG